MTDSTRTTDFYEDREQTLFDANELVLNMGPQHPSTHGVLRVILKLDGEKVLNAECVIGYLHRGVEKIAENRTYTMFNPYVDRMDYVAAVSNGLGYCLAIEKLLNVEAPPRACYIRGAYSSNPELCLDARAGGCGSSPAVAQHAGVPHCSGHRPVALRESTG